MHRVHDAITLGRRLSTRSAGAFAVHEVAYPHGWRVAPHAHAHANLTFVTRGAIEESAAGTSGVLRACHAVLKPAEVVHADRCGPDGASTLVIELPADELSGIAERDGARHAFLWGPEIARAALRAREWMRSASSTTLDELREIVVETVGLVPERVRSRGSPAWLPRARGLLHDGFAAPLRVQDLARELGLHPVYLARAFRRASGCSVTAYRRRLQLGDAARRLAASDEPLAAVALHSGFADQSHLCRAFRAALGVTPGNFRRRMRADPRAAPQP